MDTFIDLSSNSFTEYELLDICKKWKDENKLEQIEELSLYFNDISYFPDFPKEFIELKNLKKLYLSKNYISNIKNICKLKNLKDLYLDWNYIQEIPKSITILKHLETLKLSDNRLNCISKEILKIKSLTFLDISSNEIQNIPNNIYFLENVKTLKLSNNHIKNIPNQLYKLKNLQELDLKKNNISKISNKIGKLKKLEYVDFSRNNISKLPINFYDLINLKYMNFSQNHIRYIHKDIQKLINIETINLSLNCLKEIPNRFPNFKILFLSESSIEKIPNELLKHKGTINVFQCEKLIVNQSILNCRANIIYSHSDDFYYPPCKFKELYQYYSNLRFAKSLLRKKYQWIWDHHSPTGHKMIEIDINQKNMIKNYLIDNSTMHTITLITMMHRMVQKNKNNIYYCSDIIRIILQFIWGKDTIPKKPYFIDTCYNIMFFKSPKLIF